MVTGVEVEVVLTNQTICYGISLASVGRVLLVTFAVDISVRLNDTYRNVRCQPRVEIVLVLLN